MKLSGYNCSAESVGEAWARTKKAAKKYFTTAKISIGISKYGRRLWNISDMIRGVSFDKYTSFLSNEF